MSVCILVLQQMEYAHIRKGYGEWYSCKTKYIRICESLATFWYLMITFLLSNVFEFMILRFFVLLQQKVSSMFLSNVFWHAHSTHLWPSMNFGLQLSSYKFRTISSKATSIDYNHPSFSSDPTNIHDCCFRFHISRFLTVCG